MVRKNTTNRKRKKQHGNGLLLLVAILVFVMSLGFFLASRKSSNNEHKSFKEIISGIVPSVKKAVVGDTNLDLIDQSQEAHRIIDEIIINNKDWQMSDDGRKEQKADRADGPGKVTWQERTLLIGIPYGDSLRKAVDKISDAAEAKGLVAEDDRVVTYVGEKAIALNVGISVAVGKEKKTFITDRIIVFNGDQTNEKSKEIAKEEKIRQKAQGKKYSGKMAIVIDDCGYDLGLVRALAKLPIDMAFAVLPFKSNSTAALQIIKNNSQVAMLHLPMEPLNSYSSETRSIKVGMSKQEIQKLTREALNSLPGVKGVNNHQGSKATSDYNTMFAVLEVLKKEDLFFVDSRTSASSLGYKLAGQMGVRTGRNQLFLDNSSEVSQIKKKIWEAAASADKNGSIIVISHARPATAEAWRECYKELVNSGIKIVPISQLLI